MHAQRTEARSNGKGHRNWDKDKLVHKRLLLNGLKYLLGFALLAYVVWRSWSAPPGSHGVGLKDALARPIQLIPLALSTIIYSGAIVFTFLRWYTLVRAQELPFSLS